MKYFRIKEFDCSCCGKGSGKKMDINFLRFIDELRKRCSFPFVVSSGFRCKNKQQSLIDNPKYKASSPETSSHCKGLAADIIITDSKKRAKFVFEAMQLTHELCLPFRVGLAGKDKGNFAHIDIDDTKKYPKIWFY